MVAARPGVWRVLSQSVMKIWICSGCALLLASLTWAQTTDFAAAEADQVVANPDQPQDAGNAEGSVDDAPGTLIESEKVTAEPGDEADLGEGAGPETVPTAAAPAAPAAKRKLGFRVTVQSTYDSNIFIQEKNPTSDLIFSVAPGMTVGVGDVTDRKGTFALFSYDATLYAFLDNPNLDTVNHDAALQVQWAGARLTLDSSLTFRDLTETDTELGQRIRRRIYDGRIRASYAWSAKTTLGAELNNTYTDYDRQLDSEETSLALFGDYTLSQLTQVGLGVTLGRQQVTGEQAQTYEQLLARLKYALASKVDFEMQAGGEVRQSGGGGTRVTPVVQMEATWSPSPLWRVSLDGYRRVQPSISQSDSDATNTGLTASVFYKFLDRFEVGLTEGFERSDYGAVGGGSSVDRHDNYFMSMLELDYRLTEAIHLDIFYLIRTNDSTATDRSFHDQQIGIGGTWLF